MIARYKPVFRNINKHIFVTVISAFMMCGIVNAGEEEQDDEILKVQIRLTYNKYSDNSKTLTATVTAKVDNKPQPVIDVPVGFFSVSDTINKLLGTVNTNEDGVAIFTLSKEQPLTADSTGTATFMVEFEGNDKYKSASTETSIRDVRLEISLSIEDSVKTATVTAYEISGNGEEIPLNEIDVYLYVTRLFSMLKVGEGWMEGGEAVVPFPDDLPGDTLGNVTIVAKIEDSDLHGNIEKQERIDWGVAQQIIPFDHPPRLFGAPIWAIIILYIFLFAAILHTLYALYGIFVLVKRNNKS